MEEEEDPFDPDTKGEIGSLFYFVLCMTAFQRNSVVVAQAKKPVAGIEQRRANRKSNRSVELFSPVRWKNRIPGSAHTGEG